MIGFLSAKYMEPRLFGTESNIEKVLFYKEKMHEAFQQMQDFWLKNSQYLCGSQMTIADIIGACEIYQYKFGSEEEFAIKENYPLIA